MGELDRDEKIAFLQSLDVFSVPTVYRESKGLPALEAMANGVPVVQPRHGAFTEMIEKTVGGILVEPDDPESLADGLLAIWQNPVLAENLGRSGTENVRAFYSAERMAARALEVEPVHGLTDGDQIHRVIGKAGSLGCSLEASQLRILREQGGA